MNRIIECVTMIIVAMLLSIGFTGQHSTYAEAPLRIKVNVVFSIQDNFDPKKDAEPTEIELLIQLYVERELDALDYVDVVEAADAFELTIFVQEWSTVFKGGGEYQQVRLFYVLTKRHADGRCRCYVVSGLTGGERERLREKCKEFVANLAHKVLEKYKP